MQRENKGTSISQVLKKNDCGIFKCINGPTKVDVNNTGIDKSDSGTISRQNTDRSRKTGLLDGASLFHLHEDSSGGVYINVL